mmetsp:Transcript_644/g.1318  ORF Transcript_644/g.1318 Transcript_644/m.1318 type:complete len:117 (+) Transcript_644:142-492(+)
MGKRKALLLFLVEAMSGTTLTDLDCVCFASSPRMAEKLRSCGSLQSRQRRRLQLPKSKKTTMKGTRVPLSRLPCISAAGMTLETKLAAAQVAYDSFASALTSIEVQAKNLALAISP